MQWTKRALTGAAVVGLMLAASAGCSAKIVKLVWWDPYGPPFSVVAQHIIDDFNATHPSIKVTRKMVGWDESTLIEKVAVAVMAGNGPDMAHAPSSTMASELWVRGLTLPMDSYIASDKKFWAWVYPAIMESLQYKGRQLGFPDCAQGAMLYWNKDQFAQAGLDPETAPRFEDLKLYATKLTKKAANGAISVVGFHPANIWGGLENWVSICGGSLFDTKAGKLTINSPTVLSTLSWLQDMTRDYMQGSVAQSAASDWDGTQFALSKVSMMMGHQYVMKHISASKKKVNFTIGLTPAPGGLGGGRGPLAGTDCNFILRSTRHPDEAYQFMKFFVEKGGWLTDSPDPACLKDLNEAADPIGVPAGKWSPVAVKVLDYTRPHLSIPGGFRILDNLSQRVNECLQGKKSPQQALTEAQANSEKLYNDALKRAKWAR